MHLFIKQEKRKKDKTMLHALPKLSFKRSQENTTDIPSKKKKKEKKNLMYK